MLKLMKKLEKLTLGRNSLVLLVIVFVAVILSFYFYSQYQKSQQLLKNPTAAARQEITDLKNKVGKLIELPANEEPTVATVSDKNKLKDQEFFAKAQNGDKVLIYTKIKKAILYRPSTNKIIEVSIVNLGEASAAQSPQPSAPATKTFKAALYNGTTTVGYTKTVEAQLKAGFPNLQVVSRDNASKDDYTQTIVVDLSGSQSGQAKLLAESLNGKVSSLPGGEVRPSNADFLIILGK